MKRYGMLIAGLLGLATLACWLGMEIPASNVALGETSRVLSHDDLRTLMGGGANGVCQSVSGCGSSGSCNFNGPDPGCTGPGDDGNACQNPASYTQGGSPQFCNRNTQQPAKCYSSPFSSGDELNCQRTRNCNCKLYMSGAVHCTPSTAGAWSKTACVDRGSVLQGQCSGTVHANSNCP